MDASGPPEEDQPGLRHEIQLLSERMDAGFTRMEALVEQGRHETRADLARLRADLQRDLAGSRGWTGSSPARLAAPGGAAHRRSAAADVRASIVAQTNQLGAMIFASMTLWTVFLLAVVASHR